MSGIFIMAVLFTSAFHFSDCDRFLLLLQKNVLRQIPYPKTNVHCLIFHGALPLFLLYQVNVYSMRFKRKPAKHFCLLSFFKYLIRIVFVTTYIIYVKRFSRSFVFDWTPVKYFPTHFSWLNLRYIQERKKKDLGMQCKRRVSWSNILKRVRWMWKWRV